MREENVKLNLTQEERRIFSKKLNVDENAVEKFLNELVRVKIFVHYAGELPQFEEVCIIHHFQELNLFSAKCELNGLLKLLRHQSVVKIERVPTVKALSEKESSFVYS
jgi:Mg2+ and Co2+ transporter CorA